MNLGTDAGDREIQCTGCSIFPNVLVNESPDKNLVNECIYQDFMNIYLDKNRSPLYTNVRKKAAGGAMTC